MTGSMVENLTAVSDQNIFREGTRAYFDTFSGMIPCVVLEISEASYGFRVGSMDAIKFKLTADSGAYKKGEILTACASHVVPQSMVRNRKFDRRIITTYKYESSK